MPQFYQSYLEERNHLFEKLEKKLNETKGPITDELVMLIDSLRLRFGSDGEKRLSTVEGLFRHFVDSLIPNHMKYLLYTAQEGKDMFSGGNGALKGSDPSQQSKFYSELGEYVGVSAEKDAEKKKQGAGFF